MRTLLGPQMSLGRGDGHMQSSDGCSRFQQTLRYKGARLSGAHPEGPHGALVLLPWSQRHPPHTHTPIPQLVSNRPQPGDVAEGLCAGDQAPGPAACLRFGLGTGKTTVRGYHGGVGGVGTRTLSGAMKTKLAATECGRHCSDLAPPHIPLMCKGMQFHAQRHKAVKGWKQPKVGLRTQGRTQVVPPTMGRVLLLAALQGTEGQRD